MDIKIKNKKTYQGEGFYIGRPSPLGNPFKVTKYTSREEAIDQYENWILKKLIQNDQEITNDLNILYSYLVKHQHITLICWCSPKSCHGEIIKKLLLHKYYYGEYIQKGDKL